MTRRLTLLQLVFVAFIVGSAQTSRVAEVFAKVIPALHEKTSVPLRFPNHMSHLDKETVLYANTRSVDEAGYWVVLGATPDGNGQHVCSYGFFVGTTRPVSDFVGDRQPSPVVLRDGIRGSFYDTECGAYCDESLIVWSEGTYHYVIGLKAWKKSDMIAVANSAIGSSQSN